MGGDNYGSTKTSGGYGNDSSDTYGSGNTGSGLGGDNYGSSKTTGSSGFGNDSSNTYGSGNNTSSGYGDDSYDSSNKKNDSTMGKLMEKAGGMLKNEKIQEKGTEKRAAAGSDEYSSGTTDGYGGVGNTDSYGSGNNRNNDY